MRALCGAIITAGAVIALGLTAIGIGTRYALEKPYDNEGKTVINLLSKMDHPLMFVLAIQVIVVIVGLGIAILGLAYHHARREREFAWEKERLAAQQRTMV